MTRWTRSWRASPLPLPRTALPSTPGNRTTKARWSTGSTPRRGRGMGAPLSTPPPRENFRHKSYVGMAAKGTVCGFGADSYLVALDAATRL